MDSDTLYNALMDRIDAWDEHNAVMPGAEVLTAWATEILGTPCPAWATDAVLDLMDTGNDLNYMLDAICDAVDATLAAEAER